MHPQREGQTHETKSIVRGGCRDSYLHFDGYAGRVWRGRDRRRREGRRHGMGAAARGAGRRDRRRAGVGRDVPGAEWQGRVPRGEPEGRRLCHHLGRHGDHADSRLLQDRYIRRGREQPHVGAPDGGRGGARGRAGGRKRASHRRAAAFVLGRVELRLDRTGYGLARLRMVAAHGRRPERRKAASGEDVLHSDRPARGVVRAVEVEPADGEREKVLQLLHAEQLPVRMRGDGAGAGDALFRVSEDIRDREDLHLLCKRYRHRLDDARRHVRLDAHALRSCNRHLCRDQHAQHREAHFRRRHFTLHEIQVGRQRHELPLRGRQPREHVRLFQRHR